MRKRNTKPHYCVKMSENIRTIKDGCPVCSGDVTGSEKAKFYCKRCNVMYELRHIEINKSSCALFVGRFQPFHNGHLWAVKKILEENEMIIIGVGSSQYSNTMENPFSFEERKEMIKRTLAIEGITNYKVVAIPDIHDHSQWAKYVMDLVKGFHYVYTGSELTRKLFTQVGVRVKELHRKSQISASEVRFRIIKDMDWKELIPETVIDFLIELDGVERIKKLSRG